MGGAVNTVEKITAIAAVVVICMSIGCERESSKSDAVTVTQETPAVPTPTLTQKTPSVPTATPIPTSTSGPMPTDTPIPTPSYGPDCGPLSHVQALDRIDHFVDWTRDGSSLIYDDGTAVMMVNADGSRRLTVVNAKPGSPYFPSGFHADLSPDGSRIAFSSCQYKAEDMTYNYEIASVAIDGSDRRRLTNDGYMDHYPAWSPDGRSIAFIRGRGYRPVFGTLRVMLEDGSDQQDLMLRDPRDRRSSLDAEPAAPAWSPDGQQLAFVAEGNFSVGGILYTVRADGSELLEISETTVSPPSWSPDGSSLAFAKLDGDDVALYTVEADGSDPRAITKITDRETFRGSPRSYRVWISTLAWSPEGSHIMFGCAARICVVDLDGVLVGESPFEEALWEPAGFEQAFVNPRPQSVGAWSADGSRIAVRVPIGSHSNPGGGNPVVYTMDPDGSNVRVLVRTKQSP